MTTSGTSSRAVDSVILEEEIDPDYVPDDKEVREYAKWLGIDLEVDGELIWIAREGLMAPLPEEWKPCKTKDSGDVYYFNFKTGDSTWDHPCDGYYKRLYEEEKKKKEIARKDSTDKRKIVAKQDVSKMLFKAEKKKQKKSVAGGLSTAISAPVTFHGRSTSASKLRLSSAIKQSDIALEASTEISESTQLKPLTPNISTLSDHKLLPGIKGIESTKKKTHPPSVVPTTTQQFDSSSSLQSFASFADEVIVVAPSLLECSEVSAVSSSDSEQKPRSRRRHIERVGLPGDAVVSSSRSVTATGTAVATVSTGIDLIQSTSLPESGAINRLKDTFKRDKENLEQEKCLLQQKLSETKLAYQIALDELEKKEVNQYTLQSKLQAAEIEITQLQRLLVDTQAKFNEEFSRLETTTTCMYRDLESKLREEKAMNASVNKECENLRRTAKILSEKISLAESELEKSQEQFTKFLAGSMADSKSNSAEESVSHNLRDQLLISESKLTTSEEKSKKLCEENKILKDEIRQLKSTVQDLSSSSPSRFTADSAIIERITLDRDELQKLLQTTSTALDLERAMHEEHLTGMISKSIHDAIVQKLNVEIETIKSERELYDAQLKGRLLSAREERDHIKSSYDSLKRDSSATIQALSTERDSLRTVNARLVSRGGSTTSASLLEADQLITELSQQRAEITRLTSDLTELSRLKTENHQVKKVLEQLPELLLERDNLRVANQKLRIDTECRLQESQTEVLNLRDELVKSKLQSDTSTKSYKADVEMLQIRLQRAQIEYEKCTQELVAENKVLQSQLEAQTALIGQQYRRKEDFQTAIAMIDQLQAENNRLSGELASVRPELQSVETAKQESGNILTTSTPYNSFHGQNVLVEVSTQTIPLPANDNQYAEDTMTSRQMDRDEVIRLEEELLKVEKDHSTVVRQWQDTARDLEAENKWYLRNIQQMKSNFDTQLNEANIRVEHAENLLQSERTTIQDYQRNLEKLQQQLYALELKHATYMSERQNERHEHQNLVAKFQNTIDDLRCRLNGLEINSKANTISPSSTNSDGIHADSENSNQLQLQSELTPPAKVLDDESLFQAIAARVIDILRTPGVAPGPAIHSVALTTNTPNTLPGSPPTNLSTDGKGLEGRAAYPAILTNSEANEPVALEMAGALPETEATSLVSPRTETLQSSVESPDSNDDSSRLDDLVNRNDGTDAGGLALDDGGSDGTLSLVTELRKVRAGSDAVGTNSGWKKGQLRKIVEREMVAAGVLLDELEAERRALRERQISLRAQKREWAQNALTTGKDAHRISKTIHAGRQQLESWNLDAKALNEATSAYNKRLLDARARQAKLRDMWNVLTMPNSLTETGQHSLISRNLELHNQHLAVTFGDKLACSHSQAVHHTQHISNLQASPWISYGPAGDAKRSNELQNQFVSTAGKSTHSTGQSTAHKRLTKQRAAAYSSSEIERLVTYQRESNDAFEDHSKWLSTLRQSIEARAI